MIITQKYNSACDIDPEFIPSLEKLLSSTLPSFELLKTFEKNAPENHNFAYYLFFGDKTNAPIGFAQLNIIKNKSEQVKTTLLQRLLKKESSINTCKKKIFWKIPGTQDDGIIFDPHYVKYASEKTNKIIHEYIEREDILEQSFHYTEAYSQITDQLTRSRENLVEMKNPQMLIKSKPCYKDYLASLEEDQSKAINKLWRDLELKFEYKLGEYKNFKDIFAYKKEGAKQYKELKLNPLFAKYLQLENEIKYLTLETDHNVTAIAIMINGQSQHLFYDFLILDQDIESMIMHQISILSFYETNGYERLHFLGTKKVPNIFMKMGFSFQRQYILNINKKELLCNTK